MNEITKIHLGRQAFTIAIDAHKALQAYLHEIKREVGSDSQEVLDEVELRMVELLADRGVTGDKVILEKDVDYLKEQLGSPRDFKDEDEADTRDEATDGKAIKRLFRDTQNGMVAGVAAGIAKYIGIDAVWVRLAFLALMFAGASGFLLYIVLWLIVPEAKTSSERLQMQGKHVTVNALKDVVDRADVKGTAERAGRSISAVVSGVLKAILAMLGLALIIGGVGSLLGLATGGIYLVLNHAYILPFNIFPVGIAEHVLVGAVIAAIALLCLFLLFGGLALLKRKAPLPGWAVGALVAMFLASLAIAGALGAGAAPKIHQRYEAAQHSEIRTTKPFTSVNIVGDEHVFRILEVQRRYADDYKVELHYFGNASTKDVTTKEVQSGKIEVDVRKFKSDPQCQDPCVFNERDLQVFVYTPEGKPLTITGNGIGWYTVPSEANDTIDFGEPGDEIPALPDVPKR